MSAPELDRVLEAARAAWPDLPLPDAVFLRHLDAHAPAAEPERASYLASVHAGDLYLACACIEDIPRAAGHFHSQVLAQLLPALRRASGDDGAEVVQAVAERLLVRSSGAPARIAGYSGRAPLVAWARVAAVRVASNLRRGAVREAMDLEASLSEDVVAAGVNPELDYFKLHYASELKAALSVAVAELGAEERLALRLHYLQHLTGAAVAQLLRVDRSTVVRSLSRARETLATVTERVMRERLRLSAAEFESVARLVQSRIEASLARIFSEAG